MKCDQAYHAALQWGQVIECVKTERHWKHADESGSVKWWGGGGLTDEEKVEADRIRAMGGLDPAKTMTYLGGLMNKKVELSDD